MYSERLITGKADTGVSQLALAQADPEQAGAAASVAWDPSTAMDKDEWQDWSDSLSEQERRERRSEIIVKGLRAGYTLQAMGVEYGVSGERIRQLVTKVGIDIKDLRRQQQEQEQRRRFRLERDVIEFSLEHPELTLQEISDLLELEQAAVAKLLGNRLVIHEPESQAKSAGDSRTADEELLKALKLWAEQATTLTGDDYSSWAKEQGIPGKQTIATRFGSWNDAMFLAGLAGEIVDRGGLRPRISDEELWASVLEFTRQDRPTYSFQAYEEFARERELGSGATLRNRLGTWTEVRKEIQKLLRYAVDRDGSWEWGERVLDVIPGEAERNFVTKKQAGEALARVSVTFSGPVTVMAYEKARSLKDPNAVIIQSRYGSWVDALLENGLQDRMSAKARHRLSLR